MRYLLDTHAFLWWITDDSRLSSKARAVVKDSANEILVSAASAWEISIKARLGRLEIPGDVTQFIPAQMAANGFASLAIEHRHALHVFNLPPVHRDPFDRMLVAQAQVEDLPLVSADPTMSEYGVSLIW